MPLKDVPLWMSLSSLKALVRLLALPLLSLPSCSPGHWVGQTRFLFFQTLTLTSETLALNPGFQGGSSRDHRPPESKSAPLLS